MKVPVYSFLAYLSFFAAFGDYCILFADVVIAFLRHPPRWSFIREQLYQIGVLSLPVVSLTGFSTGLVLATQSFFQLSDKGLAGATGIMVAKAMVTELGPILTSFMITGRVGAAMCAEIGTMKVTEQIDALCTLRVDPKAYLIAPRFIAGLIMSPLLTIFSIMMGIFGGYLIAVYFFKMSPISYFDPISNYMTPFDFFVGMFKSVFFGLLIITICCYKGIHTSGGAEGVGRSTTSSVVLCYSVILFANFIITMGLNLIRDAIEKFL